MTNNAKPADMLESSSGGNLSPKDGYELPLGPPSISSGSANVAISRDEMNLAEFPLTVLSKRADPNLKTLEFTDSIRGKNGDVVNRSWIITGADKFGLPTASDDEVLLGLLKLTADDGLKNRRVYFTRYELLRILRWTTEGRSYSRLQNALDRLSGVRIKATNAFYDNDSKLHSTRNFGILDAYEINDGRDARPSFFSWSDVLFKSFQAGFIKKLDLDFYLSLQSAVSKRLYRYLDKHFWYKSRLQINLFTLAHEKVGVSRNYGYASSLKQQLDPAFEELIKHGLLERYEYLGKGKSTDVVIFAAKGQRHAIGQTPDSTLEVKGDKPALLQQLIAALTQRGIQERQAEKLLAAMPEPTLRRVGAIVEYFDSLVATKSRLISRSPQGFLYRAVENPQAFVLPEERSTIRGMASEVRQSSLILSQSPRRAPPQHASKSESDYLVARKRVLEGIQVRMQRDDLCRIRATVESALEKIRPLISSSRFEEAIQHGVEQKLLTSEKFPDFEHWNPDSK
jgi:Replication initiator protein A